MMGLSRLMEYFLAVMGLLFFLPPLIVIAYKLKFRIGSKKAIGKCIRIERNRDPETKSVMINPVIEFYDADGIIREFRTGTGYGLRYMPKLNGWVKLYYRPGTDPLKAQLASRGLWDVSLALMLTGALLMLPLAISLASSS